MPDNPDELGMGSPYSQRSVGQLSASRLPGSARKMVMPAGGAGQPQPTAHTLIDTGAAALIDSSATPKTPPRAVKPQPASLNFASGGSSAVLDKLPPAARHAGHSAPGTLPATQQQQRVAAAGGYAASHQQGPSSISAGGAPPAASSTAAAAASHAPKSPAASRQPAQQQQQQQQQQQPHQHRMQSHAGAQALQRVPHPL